MATPGVGTLLRSPGAAVTRALTSRASVIENIKGADLFNGVYSPRRAF